MTKAQFRPTVDVDASYAHLFKCDEEKLFAVSMDGTGRNLPEQAWRYIEAFALGIHEAMPRAVDPEPIMRGLRTVGYYIWREGHRNPSGTSQ